ncbi:beta-galactosidase trimerization domain-containing protein [Paraburkholderia sp. LEh10]|uniref:beta-galactosidase trimerization domain-containing protein n=1 Tax=Paraburkholderia sp. LEh10 TaxID=2821353 RepID=UPI001AE125CC|nr:beta-galactosidase trimerization domain-containing protein [Paraburkholderia sp. LEh10]MBP0589531.1 beta-galactosidase trimerization domain-containing protein [Paraburkholderia sp. LEh10]
MERHAKPLRYRQIHLDFHTSEHIPDVGAHFDPVDFAATLKKANVDSITVFAKCHHGWSYYPTKVGHVHPNLSRPDLLGDMIKALKEADIESPVYMTVQWDERTAREHPDWRVLSATNAFVHESEADRSSAKQLSPAWHTLCLSHAPLRKLILDQAREVATRYDIPGLFFDIVMANDCVCTACIDRMLANGLDPENARDRHQNDEAVLAQFRGETSAALFAEFPHLRVFYNAGHIARSGSERYKDYTHLELESLPTGGWGYNHLPTSARYAATLGLEYMAQTGKFHSSWGEFGGFKHADALEYECAHMAALGSRCLIGDVLHPGGAIDHNTYERIAPAFARIAKLEPFLEGAKQVSEIAILSAEHMHPGPGRHHPSDDGAVQMLLELHRPFDVVDSSARFEDYRLLVLPDDIPVDEALARRLDTYVAGGGKLLASWRSARNGSNGFVLDFGLSVEAESTGFWPSYVEVNDGLDPRIPSSPVVFYDDAPLVRARGAEVLGEIRAPYFNRTYRHFCSHAHAPHDINAQPLGVAASIHDGMGYVAYPIFRLYRAVGQPIYRYIVDAMLSRLMPRAAVSTDLPSSGRVTLTHQPDKQRHVLHLLYGPPQLRGQAMPIDGGATRMMEIIEDIPAIGPISATVRLPRVPTRSYDALSGESFDWTLTADGAVQITVPRMRIHAAVAFETEHSSSND